MPPEDESPAQYVGVDWDEEQLAWRASIDVGGANAYEDFYADEELAALGRELALLWNRWDVARNFHTATLEDVARRVAQGLRVPLEDSAWHPWAAAIGLRPEEFEALVGHEEG